MSTELASDSKAWRLGVAAGAVCGVAAFVWVGTDQFQAALLAGNLVGGVVFIAVRGMARVGG